jgi:hypothetical protein
MAINREGRTLNGSALAFSQIYAACVLSFLIINEEDCHGIHGLDDKNKTDWNLQLRLWLPL